MADRIEEVLGDARMPQILTPAQIAAIAAALDEAGIGDKAQAFDEGVSAAFMGAVTRQNAEDVKRDNPYRTGGSDD